MAFTYIFKRVEKKYMLTKEQYESLIEAITPYMEIDKYNNSMILYNNAWLELARMWRKGHMPLGSGIYWRF